MGQAHWYDGVVRKGGGGGVAVPTMCKKGLQPVQGVARCV